MSWSAREVLRAGLSLAALLGGLVLTAAVISGAAMVKRYETDLAEINDVRYGLLDANNWVDQVSAILERRIDEFELTDRNRPVIKRNVERVLDRLLVEIDAYQRRHNEGSGNWFDRVRGSLRQGVQDLFLDLDDLRAKVPFYAEKVMEELAKPEAKADIKTQLKLSLADMVGATFAETDRSGFEAVLARYGCADAEVCRALLEGRIPQSRAGVQQKTVAVIALVVFLFLIALYRSPSLSQLQMLVLTLATLVLLAGGLMAPMIGIEAKISSLRLQLLGEPVVFENQVLYFQSKSVLDVVRVLVETGEADMLLVGSLIALFSVVFPLGKVVASYFYFHDVRGARGSALVRFFALKSGKWSMADVMVIAMFMAFVGFRGLVSDQLATLAGEGKAVEVLTTNGTLLEVGFYLFLSFTLASLVVSTVLDGKLGERHVT
jgi:hypothetical protein